MIGTQFRLVEQKKKTWAIAFEEVNIKEVETREEKGQGLGIWAFTELLGKECGRPH